jgi:hypothetical protein
VVSGEVGRRVLNDISGVHGASSRHEYDGQKWIPKEVARMGRSIFFARWW